MSALFGVGATELAVLLVILPLLVLPAWALGTLLKAALGWDKWLGALYLVPFANYVVLVVAGFQAHKKLLAGGQDQTAVDIKPDQA